jgi:hypothetical protein
MEDNDRTCNVGLTQKGSIAGALILSGHWQVSGNATEEERPERVNSIHGRYA